MKKAIAVMVLLFCGIAGAQSASVVEQAKEKIVKEKHERMVQHAKTLLEKKASLEAELATVNAKLEKLENGQDVKVDAPSSESITFVGSSNICGYCTLNGCCCTTAGSN